MIKKNNYSMDHLTQALLKAGEIQKRISLIPSGKLTEDIELWLLSYLFCREGFVLKGYFNYHKSVGFGLKDRMTVQLNFIIKNNTIHLYTLASVVYEMLREHFS